ncbi:NUDIX hydrolase domain-like protein [Niveomyces insectorum RCEF 264]|uniref:NUDIX hydrolase domain-like protein n=1 Tax=Niveomyces insectorum RCEF 264 TaxID=1081102 RepID=A0A167Y178_9HYPO|nr:NUDIX hydrolase domain-like protein [Niveomyces insectorum RCEF 264]
MPPFTPAKVFTFTVDPSLADWQVSPRRWMADHNKHWDGLAVAAVVFDDRGRVLLVQRAAHDSMPNRWEVPGGAADEDEDENEIENKNKNDSSNVASEQFPPRTTILGAAARELWEEAGLVATRFTHLIPQPPLPGQASPGTAVDHPGLVFANRTGKKFFCRFAFAVQVQSCDRVTLDPDEHQAYVWATEDEVRQQRMAGSGQVIPLTVPEAQALVLEAFRLRAAKADEVNSSGSDVVG